MSNHKQSALGRGFTILCVAGSLAVAGLATAEPASLGTGQDSSAFRAFGKFAKSWMADMEQREKRNRARPTVQKQGSRPYASYTGYAPEWDVEVHATGDANSPYVGVLRYHEQNFTCQDKTTRTCSVSSSTPVTEVFPYRNGAWKY